MSYGIIGKRMERVIADLVQGKTVWDLGSGDFGRSRLLLRLGAEKVIAIDKAEPLFAIPGRVEFTQTYFLDAQVPPEGIDVVFLGFPQNNHLPGLVRILEAAKVVIYLGCNTNGTVCGHRRLWDHLTARNIVHHLPQRRNSLIVYGNETRTPSVLVGDEYAALSGKLLDFEDAQAAAFTS